MKRRSRKRPVRSIAGKAVTVVLAAGAGLAVFFLLWGWLPGWQDSSQERGEIGENGQAEPDIVELPGAESLWLAADDSGRQGAGFAELDAGEALNGQEDGRYQDFLERMESVKNRAELEDNGFTVIEEHVFPLEMAGRGEVFLIPAMDEECHRMVLFFAGGQGEIVFRTEQLETNCQVPGRLCQQNRGVAAVSFPDVDKDGRQDVVLISLCNTQADGSGTTYKVGDVLFQGEGSFYRDWRLSNKLNRFGMGRNVYHPQHQKRHSTSQQRCCGT